MRIILTIIICMSFFTYAFAEKLDEIVIFEDSLAVSEKSVPSNIEIIDSKKIEAIAPLTTVELLENIRGISIKGYDAKHINVDMGGYGAEKGGLNNVVLLNGRRISNPDMSGIDWSFIPVDNIERIEVYHGGNSVMFGDRAMGGAINIVTKKPVKTGFKVITEGGSYDMFHGNIAGQYASDKLALLISVDRYETDGYRDNSELRVNTANADLTYYFDKGELNFFVNNTSSEYGLPGSLTKELINEHGREHSNTPADGGDDYEYMFGVGGKIYLPVGELNIKADSRKRHNEYTYNFFGKSDYTDEIKSKSINPSYTFKKESGDFANSFTVGVDHTKYDIDLDTKSPFGNSSFEIERTMTGYYAFDRFNFKKAVFEAGYRYQKLDDDYKSEDNDNDESENAYNVLAGYDFDKAGKVFVKYDRSFRFATTDEMKERSGKLNTDIKTQTAQQFILGYSLKKDIFYLNTDIYSQKSENEIFTNPAGSPFYNYNLDTKRKGLNITAGASTKKVLTELSYGYVDAEIEEGAYDGKEIPLLSKHKVKAVTSYKTPWGVSLSYTGKYFSNSYAGSDVDNVNAKIDAYMVSDVKVAYQVKSFDIYLKVNNVFNEQYYDYAFRSSSYSSESYYPAAERNFVAGVSYKF